MNNDNLNSVLLYLQAKYNFIPHNNHLLFIDEAQECLPIIKMMKHFCEKRRDIPLIVSRSLVRIRINRFAHKKGGFSNIRFLFPVGKINQLVIYPMTFDEFLINYKKNTYEYLMDCFNNKKQIPDSIHNDIMQIFEDYLFTGGMPEVVNTFLII